MNSASDPLIHFAGCAPICRPSCANPNPICPLICIQNGTNCKCASGYVLGPNGNCIRKADCPPQQCSKKKCDAQTHVGCICFPKDKTQSLSSFPFPASKNCSELLTPKFASCGMFGTVCKCVEGQSDCSCYVIDPPLGK